MNDAIMDQLFQYHENATAHAETVFQVTELGETDFGEYPPLMGFVGDLKKGTLHVGDRVVCSYPPYVNYRVNAMSDYGNHQCQMLTPGSDYVIVLEIPDNQRFSANCKFIKKPDERWLSCMQKA